MTNKLTQQHLRRHPEKLARFVKVRIWSEEHRAWWRPNGAGYTTDGSQAGIYDADDAWKRVRHCGPEKKISLYAVDPETLIGIRNQADLNAWLKRQLDGGCDLAAIIGEPPQGMTYSDGTPVTRPVNRAWRNVQTGEEFRIDYGEVEGPRS